MLFVNYNLYIQNTTLKTTVKNLLVEAFLCSLQLIENNGVTCEKFVYNFCIWCKRLIASFKKLYDMMITVNHINIMKKKINN